MSIPRCLAEREGFEPPIPLRVCRISSAVLSTTQPPLRSPKRALKRPRMDGRYVTKRAKTDKGRAAYIASSSKNRATTQQNDARHPDPGPHPQGIARRLLDARTSCGPDRRIVCPGLGNGTCSRFRRFPDPGGDRGYALGNRIGRCCRYLRRARLCLLLL